MGSVGLGDTAFITACMAAPNTSRPTLNSMAPTEIFQRKTHSMASPFFHLLFAVADSIGKKSFPLHRNGKGGRNETFAIYPIRGKDTEFSWEMASPPYNPFMNDELFGVERQRLAHNFFNTPKTDTTDSNATKTSTAMTIVGRIVLWITAPIWLPIVLIVVTISLVCKGLASCYHGIFGEKPTKPKEEAGKEGGFWSWNTLVKGYKFAWSFFENAADDVPSEKSQKIMAVGKQLGLQTLSAGVEVLDQKLNRTPSQRATAQVFEIIENEIFPPPGVERLMMNATLGAMKTVSSMFSGTGKVEESKESKMASKEKKMRELDKLQLVDDAHDGSLREIGRKFPIPLTSSGKKHRGTGSDKLLGEEHVLVPVLVKIFKEIRARKEQEKDSRSMSMFKELAVSYWEGLGESVQQALLANGLENAPSEWPETGSKK
jgi:hypothetical protein